MNLISFFKRPSSTSAPVARERLKLMLAHERVAFGASDVISVLQDEIVAVIAKHFPVDSDSIKIRMERGEAISTLEVEVEIPTPMCVNITLNRPKPEASAQKPASAPQRLEPGAQRRESSAQKPDPIGPKREPKEQPEPEAVELPAAADG
jgi:cell division topological specificity factor